MYNNITAVGHLTQDPESIFTSGGKQKVTLRLCISDSKAKEKTFINCEVWDKLAEVCAQYLKSGREVLINGELCTNAWTDKEGNKRSQVYVRGNSVKFLSGGGQKEGGTQQSRGKSAPQQAANESEDIPMEDDIPF